MIGGEGGKIVVILCGVEDVYPLMTVDDEERGWSGVGCRRDDNGQWFSRGRRHKTPGAWAGSARPPCRGAHYRCCRGTAIAVWTCGIAAAASAVAPTGVLGPF